MGIGGVGSVTAEMLTRCGIGKVKHIQCNSSVFVFLRCGVLAWSSVWSEVQTCHYHSLSLAPVKSRLVLPFLYRLTRVVPDKGPLNGCVCVVLISISKECDLTIEKRLVYNC